jgi:hypothetical protein
MSYASFKQEWVRSVASRTEEGLILAAPWWFGARREYRLSEAQTNEVIERVGYAGAMAFLICFFPTIAFVVLLSTEGLVRYVAAAVFVVSLLGLPILLGGLIHGITHPVLAGLSWTKAPPKPLWKGLWTAGPDVSTPFRETAAIVLLACLAFLIGAGFAGGGGPPMILSAICGLPFLYALIRKAWNRDGPLRL